MSFDFVILAAGNGSRMKSTKPKFFQEIAGRALIQCVINNCQEVLKSGDQIVVVTQDELKNDENFKDVKVAIQSEPLGTADAVLKAVPLLSSEYAIILCGDMPFVDAEHLYNLMNNLNENILISMEIPEEFSDMPYGRVLFKNGKFEKIIEYKNASEDEKKSRIANSGVYKIKTENLKKYLPKIEKNAGSGEFYLTDIFGLMRADGVQISVCNSDQYWSFHGINTMQDLARAEEIVQNKLRKKFMSAGVKLIDPRSNYFSHDTVIEPDVVIEPNVVIGTKVKIGRGSRINAFSHISDCEIREHVEIGPFARIRGGSVFMNNSSVGNFVEVKKSTFGERSKSKHLAYIGDTTIGSQTNIGAGTITCNYDGVSKHKTKIGDNVFIGSNSTLIAPLSIEDWALVGAGSVISKDVSRDSLAVSRSSQVEFPDGAKKIWKRKGKNFSA